MDACFDSEYFSQFPEDPVFHGRPSVNAIYEWLKAVDQLITNPIVCEKDLWSLG